MNSFASHHGVSLPLELLECVSFAQSDGLSGLTRHRTVFQAVYDSYQPEPALDASIQLLRIPEHPPLMGVPVFSRSLRDQAVADFRSFCLVSKSWAITGQPFLFRHICVDIPRQWENLLEVIAEPENPHISEEDEDKLNEERAGRSTRVHRLGGRLISPPQSRQGSRSRSRSRMRSPARDSDRSASIEHAMRSVKLERSGSGARELYQVSLWTDSMLNQGAARRPETPPSDHLPGLNIESLSFSSFRTVGMRRTIREGSSHRFVTLERVLRLLQGTRSVGLLSIEGELVDPYLEPDEDPHDERGRLKAVGMTEYMDSAIQREVLDELLLRGGIEVETPDGPMLTGSPAALAAAALVALDLCGCVSRSFVAGMTDFCKATQSGLHGGFALPHLRRLGLHSMLIETALTEAFVIAFSDLTHLDLTNTYASPSLLFRLTSKAPKMQLECLSLSRCKLLTSESIRYLLLGAIDASGKSRNVTVSLSQLSLCGDEATPSPLNAQDTLDIFRYAPCFQSGRLQYLDLGGVPLNTDLVESLPIQPRLVDFGCAHLWDALDLAELEHHVLRKAPALEVLDLFNTCLRRQRGSTVDVMKLHGMLWRAGPPRLRVIELDDNTLKAIAGGAGSWKVSTLVALTHRKEKQRRLKFLHQVIYGKGTRGWYVDTKAKGPEMEAVLRQILRDERLTPANFGWHPRKMEILTGLGFFGREDAGLYTFHARAIPDEMKRGEKDRCTRIDAYTSKKINELFSESERPRRID